MTVTRARITLVGAALALAAGGCQTADIGGASECQAAYARAWTAADTAVADARATNAQASITCGTLRKAGKLH